MRRQRNAQPWNAMGASLAALSLVALVACDSSESPSDENAGDESGEQLLCPGEDRAMEYEPGMSTPSMEDQLGVEIHLVESEPAPPARAENVWTVEVRQDGEPLADAAVEVTPWMPDHNHGTPITAVVSSLGEGRYRIEPVDMFMGGLWEVHFEITLPGPEAETATATFAFCVES